METSSKTYIDHSCESRYIHRRKHFLFGTAFHLRPSELFPRHADIFSPQSLNKYQYCLNNPLRYIDPDGHDYRIVEEKDKDGKLVKRYVWDRDYTYKKGDKNGAPSNARYIDTQGRAIQLWGDNTKDPKRSRITGIKLLSQVRSEKIRFSARVVVNPKTGKIVSTNPLSGAGAN